MARKKKHPEHVNHERWLVSYADFITLLFAFFVVMFAVSQVDSKKVGRFTESFSKAVGIDMFPDSGKGLLPGADTQFATAVENDTPKGSPLPIELQGFRIAITELTKKKELPKELAIIERRNELVIRLADDVLFASGDDELQPKSVQAFQAIAKQLHDRPVEVRVEGHTDDRPIHTSHFRSNWELSTSRATAVVRLLAKEGIDAKRLSAAGYGEFHPLAGNDTDEGRRKNRRVDLVISVSHPEDAK